MAGTTTESHPTSLENSDVRDALINYNKLIDDVERLRAALGRTSAGILTSAPGLTIGTTADTALKTVEFTMVIRGETVTVSAAETAFTATTHDIADPDADPREAYYTLSANASGTLTITKGDTAAADAAVKKAAPVDEVLVGWVKIQHDGTAIFDASTNALDAAHLTVTYEDAPVMAAANLTAAKIGDPTGTAVTA